MEQIHAVVLEIQIRQGDGQGGIAVKKPAVGGEDQGMGPGQGQEGPGQTARGHRQLHAGELGEAVVEPQVQHLIVEGVPQHDRVTGQGTFQSRIPGSLAVEGKQGFQVIGDASQLPCFRGHHTLAAPEGGVGAVVIEDAGLREAGLGAAGENEAQAEQQ